jgi:hypothetical protein
MVRAIRERIVIGQAGRVTIDRSDLPEGSPAEVIVLVDDGMPPQASAPRSLSSFIGTMKGQFPSTVDADAHLRQLRDEWDRP